MNAPTKIEFETRTLSGPSVLAPFAAVIAEFAIPTKQAISKGLSETLKAVLPETVKACVQAIDWDNSFETLVAALARAFHDCHGPNDLPCRTARTSSGRGQVCLAYNSERLTILCLQLGCELGWVGYTQGAVSYDPSGLIARLRQFDAIVQQEIGEIARPMIRAARALGIPFFQIVPGQRIWQYGQGKYGRHFFATSSQSDSQTGHMLQHNKAVSNVLVRRLGFRGVKHGVADSADSAIRLATEIGYPVVVKPIDSSQGRGVTIGLTTVQEINTAFAIASGISPGRVLVEHFVEGDVFRLAVFGGRLAYVNMRFSPQVVGTGEHTIVELIDIENQRRQQAGVDIGSPKKLKVDAEMLATLQKQKLALNDRVPAGQVVRLRRMANVAGGGTSRLVTDKLHPDNKEMAETIARCFRLDTVGIDFITPDITKSWRDVTCAIIEVNSTPTFSFPDAQAKLILERAFPAKFTGRIPSVVLVTSKPTLVQTILPVLQQKKLTIGFVDHESMLLRGQPRIGQHARMVDRVAGLLLDPACEALVVACTADDILSGGLPLDRCDLCLIDRQTKLSEEIRTLLTQCSVSIVDEAEIDTGLAHWLSDMINYTKSL
jgi:cyanophycin synthetase